MKKLILTLGLLALGACANIPQDDFVVTDEGGMGSFTMEGTVVREVGSFEFVYLVVSNDGTAAFDYFHSYAEKNDVINKMVDGQLYFKLGILEEGSLESSANISVEAEEKILSALESGGLIELTMREEIIPAMGASEYTVMPVEID